MKCPKCKKEMGVVWVSKPSQKNSLYGLGDVEYCWKCGNLFLAKPEIIELRSPKESTIYTINTTDENA